MPGDGGDIPEMHGIPLRPDFQTKIVGAVVALITLGAVGFIGTSVLALTTSVAEANVEIRLMRELYAHRFTAMERELQEVRAQLKELSAALKK